MERGIAIIGEIGASQHGRMISQDTFEEGEVVEMDGAAEADDGVDHSDFRVFFL